MFIPGIIQQNLQNLVFALNDKITFANKNPAKTIANIENMIIPKISLPIIIRNSIIN